MTLDDTPKTPPPPPTDPPPPPAPAPVDPPPPPADAGGPVGGDRVDLGGYLSQGWQLFAENPALLGGGFAIVFIILLLSSITVVGPLLLVGPLMAGYYGIVEKLRNGQQAEFGELFAGFSDFGRTCVAGLLVVLVFVLGAVVNLIVGFVLSGIPCLGQILGFALGLAVSVVTAAATLFILPTVAVSSRSATDALTDNIGFLKAFAMPALLLGAVHIGLSLVGSALCIVGLLVTIPVASGFVMAAYHDYYIPRVQG